jgi:TorA maturation chaperone TorD
VGSVDADAGAAVSEARVQCALERAQAWRALGRAFAPPRDAAHLRADLSALRARAEGPLAQALASALDALSIECTDPHDDTSESLSAAHERLFSGRNGGVPARESAYADARIVAPIELADVRGFLRAFGLEEKGELADHVATECEIASALALKESWAIAQGWNERADVAHEAYVVFLADHLLRWIPRFATRVCAAESPAFYVAAANALTVMLSTEAARLGLSDALPGSPALPATPQPDEMGCGGCPTACEPLDA